MPLIYHVTTANDWNSAMQRGHYQAPSLIHEGFIHCSQENQVAGVLERFFEGQTGLVKLVIDAEKLTSKLIFDWSPNMTDTFPHVYGPINLDAVIEIIAL